MLDDMYILRDSMVKRALAALPFRDEAFEDITLASDFMAVADDFGLYYMQDPLAVFFEFANPLGLTDFPRWLIPRLVGIAKHWFAIDTIITFNGDEVGILEYPYLFEFRDNCRDSLDFCRKGRFRLASQALRSALETVLVHGYFRVREVPYENLRHWSIPSVGDRKRGALALLRQATVIDEREESALRQAYRSLGDAVHCQWNYLNRWDEPSGPGIRYLQWAMDFSTVIRLCLIMMLHYYRTDIGWGGVRRSPLTQS